MTYEYYDYPPSFIFDYQKQIKATTAADVQRVANQYLQPDKILTLIVGNGKVLQPNLKDLGEKVQTIDITIPDPPKS
jgi:zinc protease